MKYLALIRHREAYLEVEPPAALMEALSRFGERTTQDGTLLDTGGLLPSKDGFRVRLARGAVTVIDGPFTEAREVVGGWALLDVDSKAEAVRITQEFMELHYEHWPEFEGEAEVRPMVEPGMDFSHDSELDYQHG